MFFKTLFAFLVTAGIAGGAVYYGMQMNGVPKTSNTTHIDEKNTDVGAPNLLEKLTGTKAVPTKQSKPPNVPVTETIEILMAQAEHISSPELQGQAYMDIVNFALSHEKFTNAYTAMKNIPQTDLRDTARGQMAVSMAKSGLTAEAFDIIDQVEIDGLRDVLRLQVIEAITLPDTGAQRR